MTAFPSSRRQYRGQPSGVGIREENFADGAGHRLVTATYTFNTIQSVLQSNLGQLKTLNGTQDFSGGTLPFNMTIADQYISVPMGLTMAFTSSAVAGARTLTGRIYGKSQFGQDVVEDGVIVNAGGGAVTTIALPVGLVPSSEWFVLNLICRTSRGQAMSRARVGYANLKPW